MTFLLLAALACTSGKDLPQVRDTSPEPADTDTGDSDPPDPLTLAEALVGPLRGYFLYYDATLDAYPNEDGWIKSPTHWSWTNTGDVAAYVWNEDPAIGGYQIDSYFGKFEVEGDVLTLAIGDNQGIPEFGVVVIPEIDAATGTITWAWTMRNGVEGVIHLNPAWDTHYGIDEEGE